MLKTDYLIIGLDEMSLELTIKGTAHFMNNITSGWYSLEEISLNPGGKATLKFAPKKEVALLFPALKECTITISANEAFSLVERELYSTDEKTTAKYVLLNCRLNDAGMPYFHYDILQKTMPARKDGEYFHINVEKEKLISEGYKILKTVDDKTRSSQCIVLEGHRKTA